MGIFSSAKKLVKKVTKPVTKSLSGVKNIFSGGLKKVQDILPADLNSIDDVWSWGKDFFKNNAASAFELAGTKAGYDAQLKGIQEQNASAQQIAQKQMDFQKEMSNTAHQREITDLKAAGLNPILSGTGGMGASTPVGASAPVRSEGDAVSSAFQIFKTIADVMKTNADREFVQQAQTQKTESETRRINAETANALKTNTKIQEEINNLKTTRDNLEKTGKLTDEQTKQVKASVENLKQQFKSLRLKGTIDEYQERLLVAAADKAVSTAEGGLQDLVDLISNF